MATGQTKVVNLYKEKYDVYIGRAGKGKDGYFGNPIKIGSMCHVCNNTHNAGGDTLSCFRTYFTQRMVSDKMFCEAVKMLKGKRLGCFCKPKPCHGDVIKEYLDDMEC